MLDIKDFKQRNEHIFDFPFSFHDQIYVDGFLKEADYSGHAGLVFRNKCADDKHFAAVYPQICDLLNWISSNVTYIRKQTAEKLPPGVGFDIWKCDIVSFVLIVGKDDTVSARIDYGSMEEAEYACEVEHYVTSIIKNNEIIQAYMPGLSCAK